MKDTCGANRELFLSQRTEHGVFKGNEYVEVYKAHSKVAGLKAGRQT
jgi:hypothetical protein